MANTIVLKGLGIRKEREAVTAISPGHLVEVASATTIQVHSSAAGIAQKAFAVEMEVIGNDLNTAYAAQDWVLYEVLPQGAEVQAKVAAGLAALTAGTLVASAGDGTLAPGANPVAVVLEDVDNSGGAEEAFVIVEVL